MTSLSPPFPTTMAIWNGPTRAGNRGGRALFKWEDVKDMQFKDREMYLGQSLNLEPNWYGKDGFASVRTDRSSGRVRVEQDEIEAVRLADEEAMNEALGLAPRKRKERELDKSEMKEALARGTIERDKYDVDRVEGVGFSVAAEPSASVVDRLPGVGIENGGGDVRRDVEQGPTMPDNMRRNGKRNVGEEEELEKELEKEKEKEKEKVPLDGDGAQSLSRDNSKERHKKHRRREHREHGEHKHRDRDQRDQRKHSRDHYRVRHRDRE